MPVIKPVMTIEQAAAAQAEFSAPERGDNRNNDIRASTALKKKGYTAPDEQQLILKVLERAFIDNEISWRTGHSYPDSLGAHKGQKSEIFSAMANVVRGAYNTLGNPIGEYVVRETVQDFVQKADALISRHAKDKAMSPGRG